MRSVCGQCSEVIEGDRQSDGTWSWRHVSPFWEHSPVAPPNPDEDMNPSLREVLERTRRIEALLLKHFPEVPA